MLIAPQTRDLHKGHSLFNLIQFAQHQAVCKDKVSSRSESRRFPRRRQGISSASRWLKAPKLAQGRGEFFGRHLSKGYCSIRQVGHIRCRTNLSSVWAEFHCSAFAMPIFNLAYVARHEPVSSSDTRPLGSVERIQFALSLVCRRGTRILYCGRAIRLMSRLCHTKISIAREPPRSLVRWGLISELRSQWHWPILGIGSGFSA